MRALLKTLVPTALILLSGCATTDATLADMVKRKGDGIYKATSVGYVDGLDQAIKQCKMDGNKKLEIITTASEYDYVLRKNLTVYVFKCIDK